MAEISESAEAIRQAWNFYDTEKEQDGKLDAAIGHEGNANYDPNTQSS